MNIALEFVGSQVNTVLKHQERSEERKHKYEQGAQAEARGERSETQASFLQSLHQQLAEGREQISQCVAHHKADSAANREHIDRICTKSEAGNAANRAQISQIIKDESEGRLVRLILCVALRY